MTRYIKVGTGGGEVTWHRAMLDLTPGDYLMLEPGYYDWPRGKVIEDITIQGLGANPEDTRIRSFFRIGPNSGRVCFENLYLEPYGETNTIDLPEEANSYLIFRNCVLKGNNSKITTLAISGQASVFLFSTRLTGGSISFFATSSFRLEMADCDLDFASDDFGAISFEGEGTAIINNSRLAGAITSFDSCNIELDINNSEIGCLNLTGRTWLNLLNSQIVQPEYSLYARGDCWLNIVSSDFFGQFCLAERARVLIQNSELYSLQARDEARMTLTNVVIEATTSLEGTSSADCQLVTFKSNGDYQYFVYLVDSAQLTGRNLLFEPNASTALVEDQALLKANALYHQGQPLEIKCQEPENISLLGIKWTALKE